MSNEHVSDGNKPAPGRPGFGPGDWWEQGKTGNKGGGGLSNTGDSEPLTLPPTEEVFGEGEIMWVYRFARAGSEAEYHKEAPWLVGFFSPAGDWYTESSHATRELAAARVRWLNGGDMTQQPPEGRRAR